ncbi:MAG: hypothetical protein AB1483_05345 [Candidatus Zixiibacteriota bacterium]
MIAEFMKRVIAVLMVVSLVVSDAVARKAAPREKHGWELTINGGYRFSGSASDLESAMIVGRLNGSPCGDLGQIFCYSVDLPYTDQNRLGYTVTLSREIKPRLGLQAVYGSTQIGSTSGYYDGGDLGTQSTDAALEINGMKVTTYGLVARFNPTRLIYFSLGPAVYSLKFKVSTGGSGYSPGVQHHSERLGLLAGAGLTVPARSAVFVHLGVQYRLTGAFDVGPIDAKNRQGEVLTKLPLSNVSLNHLIFLIGLGIRI